MESERYKEIEESIIRAYLAGFEWNIAVFPGIHKLGYYNKASNSMFDIHPSSSLHHWIRNEK